LIDWREGFRREASVVAVFVVGEIWALCVPEGLWSVVLACKNEEKGSLRLGF